MSWTSFERTLEATGPALREAARAVVTALEAISADTGVDPLVLSRRADVDEVRTLAALELLRTAGLGAFVVQVVNDRGQSVGEFPSIAAIKEPVHDEYGDVVLVEPRNTRVVFRPAWV